MTALPYEPPEPPESKDSARQNGIPTIVYKVVGVILLALLIYWVWKLYTRLPPPHPIQYPADYIRTRSLGRFYV